MTWISTEGDHLSSSSFQQTLHSLYPNDTGHLANHQARFQKLIRLFSDTFPEHHAIRLFRTPGRTEIGGNHTDHQNGQVLCAAINLDIIAAAAPNDHGIIRLQSEGFPEMDQVDCRQLDPCKAEINRSSALIRGVAAAFSHNGVPLRGLDIYTSSLIPRGSGLSSSAAFEVLLATLMDTFYLNGSLSALERAQIAQFAENHYFGKPSGLMDQCACSFGGFLKIDFQQPAQPLIESIDCDWEQFGYRLIITDVGAAHDQLTDEYASITRDMSQVAHYFNASVLRDVNPSLFYSRMPVLRKSFSERTLLRAMHFFADDQRVAKQAEALNRHDFASFLAYVKSSGYSSRTQLQNIFSEKEPARQPLSLALSLSDHLLADSGASRIHGGGFAGTIQAYVPQERTKAYCDAMCTVFGDQACHPVHISPAGSLEVV